MTVMLSVGIIKVNYSVGGMQELAGVPNNGESMATTISSITHKESMV